MGLYRADSVALSYSNVEAAKQWWIDTFGCKVVRVPQDWDNPLPSDVALTLPGDSEPTILLNVGRRDNKPRQSQEKLSPLSECALNVPMRKS
jgi:hypothetical protein